MLKQIFKYTRLMAFVPIIAMPNVATITQIQAPTINEVSVMQARKEDDRVLKIREYMEARSMPLADYAEDFVATADKYGLDWNLLPAIAVRESSGGKNACYNNPFGWGSCKIKFQSYTQAIDTVGLNLAGLNPKTDDYYLGKTNYQKLHHYNGTVVATYPDEVMRIMKKIDSEVLGDD